MQAVTRLRSLGRTCLTGLLALLLGVSPARAGGGAAEAEVKGAVERFLDAAGRQDFDAPPAMFAPEASIASAAFRHGRWVTASQPIDCWLAALRVDYFTLIRDSENNWKFVNGSYTAKPVDAGPTRP
jgi:hypothetical protein